MTNFKENTVVEQEVAAPLMQDDTEAQVETPATTAQKALSVLIQAVEFAQSKGVYSFEDCHHIFNALKVFRK